MRIKNLISSLIVITLLGPFALAQREGYYRFPNLHDNVVVFVAEGDIWRVGIEGGIAQRITTHLGEESHPVISPDGRILAFAANYEGSEEIYTMPLLGGLPTRWTYDGDPSVPVGFSPDGWLIYATSALSTLPGSQLMLLDPNSGNTRSIPLANASDGVMSGDGGTIFFASPDFHRNNTRRYKGGTARDIWKFKLTDPEATSLTADFEGEDHSPMWWQGRIYYVNDRDGTMNIWSINEQGGDRTQHTRHSGWDVKSPALHAGRIVYQLGADLWLFTISTGRTARIPIQLASDFDQLREKWVQDPIEYLTAAHLHPKGESIVLTSRGRVFVAPAEPGRLVRASGSEGVRYRDAVFMPSGDELLALSDVSGEVEFVALPANGVGSGRPLTSDGEILRFQGHPSPDGLNVAYTDKNEDLWILNVTTGTQNRISSNREGLGELSWSPDSKWLAYTMQAFNTYSQIHLYEVETGRDLLLTSDRVNSFSPVWGPDGNFIYFLSDRNLESLVGSPWGPRQPEPFFDRAIKIYEIALRTGVRSPFRRPDELTEAAAGAGEKEKTSAAVEIRVEAEGLGTRIREVPVPPGNYSSLSANASALFWTERETSGERSSHLMAVKFESKNPKPVKILENIRNYELSGDGKKALVRQKDSFYVIPAEVKAPQDLASLKVDLSGWSFSLDVRQDFRQLFLDAWRLERDYFYDPGMHGVDWEAVRDRYLPLVDRVTTREELSDLIGEIVAELSALHVSVRGGEFRRGQDRIRVASLGARLTRAETAGGYRIDYIYQSDPDFPEERSPLADPELNLKAGDVIESINGASVLSVGHPNALLRNQQGKQVLLRVKTESDPTGREVIVTPIDNEADLRYNDWEYTRRLRVEEAGAGQLGYVHLRAMGSDNLTEWYRSYYPVFNRQGLVIDMRHNRGGNIDSIILEKLLRKAWFFWKSRVGEPYWNMQYAFRGHMVVLVNEFTASDGEAFAEGFRRLGLGKLIGVRTWGGEIWLSNNNLLTDFGFARAPQSGVYGPEREWMIEGHGVEPDIVVVNPPHQTYTGQDAQLEAAISYLKQEIARDPVEVPQPPPYPNKSFRYREPN